MNCESQIHTSSSAGLPARHLVIMVITVMSGVIINMAVGTDISIQLDYQQWTDM